MADENKGKKPENKVDHINLSGKKQPRTINSMVNKLVIDDEKESKKSVKRVAKKNAIPKNTNKSTPDNKSFLPEKSNDNDYYIGGKKKKFLKRRRKPVTKKSLRIRMILTCLLMAVTVLIVGITLSLTVLFKTSEFEVTGKTRYNLEDIVAASGLKQGENIFMADKEAAEKSIENAFPYVSEAKVTASFPDKIKINITEGKQAYQVKFADKQYCVVSSEGRILKLSEKKIKKIPIVKGATLQTNIEGAYVVYSDKKITRILDKLAKSIEKAELAPLSEINLKNKANISFTYDKRIKVKIGLPEDIDYKVRTAKAIIAEKLDPHNTGIIAGDLDVSACNSTRKSYFNQKTALNDNSNQKTTEATTEPTTVPADDSMNYDTGVDYGAGYDTGYDYNAGYDTGVDYGTGYDTGYDTGTDYNTGYDTGVDYGTGYDAGLGYDTGVDYGYDGVQ